MNEVLVTLLASNSVNNFYEKEVNIFNQKYYFMMSKTRSLPRPILGEVFIFITHNGANLSLFGDLSIKTLFGS